MTVETSLLEQAVAEAGGPEAFEALIGCMPTEQRQRLGFTWRYVGRPSQLTPPGGWHTWLVLAGRGFGKTRTGAEFVRDEVEAGRAGRIALVAPTAAAARDVLVEGESGILAISPPWNRPEFEPSKRRLTWHSTGAAAWLYSADEPERLRGPQHDLAWADEIAAYYDPGEVWTQLQLGLRLGRAPRAIITTTPRPIPLIRSLVKDPTVVLTRGRTADNQRNLPPAFLETITAQYGGTRIGRQELDAEILDDNPGALFHLSLIDAARIRPEEFARRFRPDLVRVVVSIDPAVSSHGASDETGIIVAAKGWCDCRGTREMHGFVIEDASGIHTAREWAMAAGNAYRIHRADRVIGETNQGGNLIEENLRANSETQELPYTGVHVHEGKRLRAEPVSSLYEQGKIHHVGSLAKLEDQMTTWDPTAPGKSPDRLDALVQAFTELLVEEAPVQFIPWDRPILRRRTAGAFPNNSTGRDRRRSPFG